MYSRDFRAHSRAERRSRDRLGGDAVLPACRGLELEVIVLDDHSEDATAAIVSELAGSDDRVRLISAPELPAGWCGKQHACWILARAAHHPLLVFLDADVRVVPDALARMAAFLRNRVPTWRAASLVKKPLASWKNC